MSKTLFAAAAAGLLMLPAVAQAQDAAPVHFVDHGVDYTYTAETKGDVRIIRGTADGGLSTFELHVTKTGISGTFDGMDVNLSRNEIARLAPESTQR